MAIDEDTAWIIWPEYFDARRSRSQGRRVPKRLAITNPSTETISRVLMRLGYEFRIEEDKSYPSNWYHTKGRILVENSGPKTDLLMTIAERLPRD
jgi:signal recognition particle subunit SRP19